VSHSSDDNFVELILTCSSWQEAQNIADVLLAKKLIACAEFIESKSKYYWKNNIEEAKEITLFMQSKSDLFDAVEKELNEIHSYETFVLRQIPLSKVSANAIKWLKESLN